MPRKKKGVRGKQVKAYHVSIRRKGLKRSHRVIRAGGKNVHLKIGPR